MPLREGSIGFPAIRGPSPARPTAGSAPRWLGWVSTLPLNQNPHEKV
jgi:hypothetical protein